MCWYSADHAGKIAEAEVGQRLVIRKVHGSSWAVAESDVQVPRPTPVCLLDATRVLFRTADCGQLNLNSGHESEAVFRMLRNPKRDVFRFADGREIDANALPANLAFDVLEIPGKEGFASMMEGDHAQEEVSTSAGKRGSLLERVFARL